MLLSVTISNVTTINYKYKKVKIKKEPILRHTLPPSLFCTLAAKRALNKTLIVAQPNTLGGKHEMYPQNLRSIFSLWID